eukprot:TRINITY_DN5243_c0_g1_i2.p2 TRINITY_DN5243_c0_g1~~TRINITY_DN5243_c0_g1_i2.p2  ORF type:complete len:139 (+),score=17.89 TRINITY_DN5243_c0_g1_i2:79-495(+)
MTPRSPRSRRAASPFTGNAMEKWVEDDKPIHILNVSSRDDRAPETNMLKRDGSFWMSTGMFPQEIIVALGEEQRISEVKLVTSNVKEVAFERVIPKKTANNDPIEWKHINQFGAHRFAVWNAGFDACAKPTSETGAFF